ncbi:MAG: MlaE family ABC transporter permease [Pseudobdellovibrionaceae bacterium]
MIQKISDEMDNFYRWVRLGIVNLIRETGQLLLFFTYSFQVSLEKPYRIAESIRHMEFIGNKSVAIITLTGLFTGMALSFQIYLGFKIVNATNLVGPVVALGITRELGPVLTGLIVAARAGGAMAARLGTMRVNEQIDALDVMGVNTHQYLVAPRLYAALLCMPVLCAVFDFVAMFGSWFLVVNIIDLDEAVFFERIRASVEPYHIYEGLFKSAVFGVVFALVCTFKGFNTTGGAKGVGDATNQGVVMSMVLIIILNFFLSSFIRIFYALTGWGG